jgi:hypothetical protein
MTNSFNDMVVKSLPIGEVFVLTETLTRYKRRRKGRYGKKRTHHIMKYQLEVGNSCVKVRNESGGVLVQMTSGSQNGLQFIVDAKSLIHPSIVVMQEL